MWSFVARRSNREVADEITAQAFCRAFELVGRYDPAYPSALPWLYSIARGLLLHRFRDDAVHRRKDRLAASREPVSATVEGVDDRLVAHEIGPALRAALRRCRDQDVELLVLTAVEELTYEQAAEVLGIPVGTVRSRLARVRPKLRELLADAWEKTA